MTGEYTIGATAADKIAADKRFLKNMQLIIRAEGGILMPFRYVRVYEYYLAIKYKGDKAFWSGKERLCER